MCHTEWTSAKFVMLTATEGELKYVRKENLKNIRCLHIYLFPLGLFDSVNECSLCLKDYSCQGNKSKYPWLPEAQWSLSQGLQKTQLFLHSHPSTGVCWSLHPEELPGLWHPPFQGFAQVDGKKGRFLTQCLGLLALAAAGVDLIPLLLGTGCLVRDSPFASRQSTAENSSGIAIKIFLCKLIAYISTDIAHWNTGFSDSENACNFSGFPQWEKRFLSLPETPKHTNGFFLPRGKEINHPTQKKGIGHREGWVQ